MSIDIVIGDDATIDFTAHLNDATFPIDSAATIQAALISNNKSQILIAATPVLEASVGSDWPNSLLVIKFTEA